MVANNQYEGPSTEAQNSMLTVASTDYIIQEAPNLLAITMQHRIDVNAAATILASAILADSRDDISQISPQIPNLEVTTQGQPPIKPSSPRTPTTVVVLPELRDEFLEWMRRMQDDSGTTLQSRDLMPNQRIRRNEVAEASRKQQSLLLLQRRDMPQRNLESHGLRNVAQTIASSPNATS